MKLFYKESTSAVFACSFAKVLDCKISWIYLKSTSYEHYISTVELMLSPPSGAITPGKKGSGDLAHPFDLNKNFPYF